MNLKRERAREKFCVVNGLSLMPPLSGVGRATLELCRRIFSEGFPFENPLSDSELSESENPWVPLYYYGYYSRRLLESETPGTQDAPAHNRFLKFALSVVRSNPFLKRTARKALRLKARLRPRFTSGNEAALYWEPNHVILDSIAARRKLLTVHDLSCMLYPQWHPGERLDFFNAHFLPGLEKADRIVTVSETMRRELAEYAHVSESRVTTVYNGVDRALFRPLSPDCLAAFRARAALPERYVLCVGSLEPRKNLKNLLEAWARLPERVKDGCVLLLIGNAGWENADIMKKIREGEGSVLLRRDVPTRDLPFYYNLAEFFVYVSLYEGFGLPPLEAMACGTPVLASDIPVHREILGDAALFTEVNPGCPQKLAERLEALLNGPFDREAAAKLCLERAARYSWDESAEKYRRIINDMIMQ